MNERKTVVVELQNKADVVAFLEFIKHAEEKYNFIFTIAYIPSEYDEDNENNIFAIGEILKLHAERYQHTVSNMLYSAENGVWFDFLKTTFELRLPTPCIACMAYSHLCRFNIAKDNGGYIIAGQNKGVTCGVCSKLASNEKIVDFFNQYFFDREVILAHPIKRETSDKEVEEKYLEFCRMYDIDPETYKFPKCYMAEANINVIDDIDDSVLHEQLAKVMDDVIEEYKNSDAFNIIANS